MDVIQKEREWMNHVIEKESVQRERLNETWGAGVDIHTVDTRPSLFQFRTHCLVRFVPNQFPLPRAY